jgi:hypothetical protein
VYIDFIILEVKVPIIFFPACRVFRYTGMDVRYEVHLCRRCFWKYPALRSHVGTEDSEFQTHVSFPNK